MSSTNIIAYIYQLTDNIINILGVGSVSEKKKGWRDLKPFQKFIGVGIVAFIGLAIIMGATGAFDETDEEKAEREARQEQHEKEKNEKEEAKAVEKKKEESKKKDTETKSEEKDVSEDVTWDDVKDKDKIVGKSDKGFKDASKAKPAKVRNDSTGNWRLTKIAESIDIEDYALSYSDLHMNDDEVHFIVNFNYDTTTTLNEMNDLLYVDIHEYEKKEEHDASTLGNGMLLKSYIIYPDGDIQEIES